jgi:hypothetical protein
MKTDTSASQLQWTQHPDGSHTAPGATPFERYWVGKDNVLPETLFEMVYFAHGWKIGIRHGKTIKEVMKKAQKSYAYNLANPG